MLRAAVAAVLLLASPGLAFRAPLAPVMRQRMTPQCLLTSGVGLRWPLRPREKVGLSMPAVAATGHEEQGQGQGAAGAVLPAARGGKKMTPFEIYEKTSEYIVNLFPVWTVICSVLALQRPELFAWLTTKYFTAGLGLLMLSMGITLSPQDFADVLKRPSAVVIGFIGCYALMPALALGMANAFGLSPDLVAGLVLVGSINGGQASNLCTYIAKGDVALSVMMTTATTLGAIFMTPLLCKFLLGTIVPVDAVGIAFSTVQVVLAPIVVGMLANK
jgi:bile acid:Na+ symporter, BASS family